MQKPKSNDVISLLGRALLANIFLLSAFDKFKNAEKNEKYMESKKIPLTPVLRPLAGALEAGVGLSLLTGAKPRWGASAALAFLVPTSIIFHDFWNESGEKKQEQMISFMKNIAIIGGLATVVANGGGTLSLEREKSALHLLEDDQAA